VAAFFIVRYRAGAVVDRSAPPIRNAWLEAAWIGIPLAIFLVFGVWGAYDYSALYRSPANAVPVYIVAKQWMWKLQHANGRREIDELHLPVGRPVRLIMTSQDVIHSFFAPALRVKQDVVPGRYTAISFTPTVAGEYPLLCAEYCGTQHSHMAGRIVVMGEADYSRWLAAGTEVPGLASRGFELFRTFGCSGCHSAQSSVHAPDLAGLIGRTVHLADGRTLVADETYVRDSILLPKKDVVAGFEPIMPSFAGQISEEDIAAVIHYIRSTGTR
jgi:cytochrome c oxidase subunit 2